MVGSGFSFVDGEDETPAQSGRFAETDSDSVLLILSCAELSDAQWLQDRRPRK